MHVIDTSVLLKWVVPEADSEEALEWVGSALAAPDLVRAELANALWKKVRRAEISQKQAFRALEDATSSLMLIPSAPFAGEALVIAFELDHPVYDCFFLAVARTLGVPLLTADRRLAKACSTSRFKEMLRPLRGVHE